MPDQKKLTLMIYFASDNPLAPGTVSQLKAIKDAGYHHDVNVIAQFDPHTENSPPHIFNVNYINKLKNPDRNNIGFAQNDSFVRNLVADKIWSDDRVKNLIKKNLRQAERELKAGGGNVSFGPYITPDLTPDLTREQPPAQSLESFLNFCATEYPAQHYILLLLGHGVVVGNDYFLFDEHPGEIKRIAVNGKKKQEEIEEEVEGRKFLRLPDLGRILRNFKNEAGRPLDLVGFHSCSMSSLEVAYELEGAANYMLASQGPAFVGSWPYRQIIMRIFHDVSSENFAERLRTTATKICSYVLYNSYDYQLAGYSSDCCLIDLTKLSATKKATAELAKLLRTAVKHPVIQELILLAHWDSQSYWQERYTDLSDFCRCLRKRCQDAIEYFKARTSDKKSEADHTQSVLQSIIDCCSTVTQKLEHPANEKEELIVHSGFAGPLYQYSRGLSVFFPWSTPTSPTFWEDYDAYRFEESGWSDFLKEYLINTRRPPRRSNGDAEEKDSRTLEQELLELVEDVTALIFNEAGQLKSGPRDPLSGGKGGGNDPTGDDCGCPSIKNYPAFTRDQNRARMLSPDFLKGFDLVAKKRP